MRQTKACPHCGETHGWYILITTRYSQYYDNKGEASHAADDWSKHGQRKLCYNCGKIINRCVEDK